MSNFKRIDRIKQAQLDGVTFHHVVANHDNTYGIVGIDKNGQAVDVHPRATLTQVDRAELLLGGQGRTRVFTYQAPNGEAIDLTQSQIFDLREADVWPRNSKGELYCTVSHGLHFGEPTFTNFSVDQFRSGRDV